MVGKILAKIYTFDLALFILIISDYHYHISYFSLFIISSCLPSVHHQKGEDGGQDGT